jgi:putative transcriptional regulator
MSERIANALKDHRKRAGLTQEELGQALRVSRQTIISIERGRYVPSLALALKIARFFECSTDEMFQLEDG